MQAHNRALLNVLRHLSLTLPNGSNMGEDDPELKVVLALTSLIYEQQILFRTQPTADRYSFLRSLVVAAYQAKAVSQAGLPSYLLLGAATSAVQDFFQLARGNEACFTALSDWEKETIAHQGTTLWPRALHRSKQKIGVLGIIGLVTELQTFAECCSLTVTTYGQWPCDCVVSYQPVLAHLLALYCNGLLAGKCKPASRICARV